MKKEEVPQDKSALANFTKEVCYATDEKGNYVTTLSTGWEVKSVALDKTWSDIEQRIQSVKEKVLRKEASPILFFMEARLMDLEILAAYTGFWQWQIKRHMKPKIFDKLSSNQLNKYAKAFNVSLEDLKTMNLHEG